jgi:hypothetical protein
MEKFFNTAGHIIKEDHYYSQPIGISEYELIEVLSKEFASALPTIEMIESEFLQIKEPK